MIDGRTLEPDLNQAIGLALGLGKQLRQNQIQDAIGEQAGQVANAPSDEVMQRLAQVARTQGPEVAQGVMDLISSGNKLEMETALKAARERRVFAFNLERIKDPRERRIFISNKIDELSAAGKPFDKLLPLANMDFEEQTHWANQNMIGLDNVDQIVAPYLLPPAPEKPTSLMKNIEATGLKPGTPEYQQALGKALMKPQSTQTVNVGGDASKSIAKQIGPILDESRQKATGAIAMFRNANNIEEALSKGDVIAGPGATLRLKAEQVASLFGFKGDGAVERTRQVIRSLAASGVEARKELAGQGQVTENEAAAVEKAMSGDINDLTVEELRLIANLNKKHALFVARQHQAYLDSIPQDDASLKPFYQLQGLDEILQYDPDSALGLPVQEPGAPGQQVEGTQVINGQTFIKLNGKWYAQ
ncbi:MAG: hypothetical protein AB2748_19805 [Candidatus Thiodiazotropha endolucinida]